jgi:hypothetical protein
MSFRDQVAAWAKQTESTLETVHREVVTELRNSWVEGSPLTGAPPLPMVSGRLRGGVTVTHEGKFSSLISTSIPYAGKIEHNPRRWIMRGGGPHGWKLTVAGANRIVEAAEKRHAEGKR